MKHYTSAEVLELWYCMVKAGRLKSAGHKPCSGEREGEDDAVKAWLHVERFFAYCPSLVFVASHYCSGEKLLRIALPGEALLETLRRHGLALYYGFVAGMEPEAVSEELTHLFLHAFQAWYRDNPCMKPAQFEEAV